MGYYRGPANSRGSWKLKPAIFGGAGIVLGGVFLWLAVRNVDPADVASALRQLNRNWLIAGVAVYLVSIALRCLRWGILLRATDNVKWRHAAEALLTGFAANFVLPGRVGELFRADYARRVFDMSRFVSLGTIVIERLCDGLVLVGALWISLTWILLTRIAPAETPWVLTVGIASSVIFGVTLVFVLSAQRIDLRRFGIREGIATRWDLLVKGISSVLQGNTMSVVLCSIGVLALDALTLASIVRGFGISLSPPEGLMLLGLASLSTLLPTAPGYVGTYQLVFGHVFQTLGYPQTIGVIAATAVQIFCFGSVTILGGIVVLSRSGLTIWRAHKWISPEGS
jgi:glycosyltransferase 2 family protein